MASVYAIAAVTQTILGILSDAVPDDFTGAQFEALQISDFQGPKPVDEGISLLLYRVDFSPLQRNLQPRPEATNKQFRPPLPVDLHYVVTAWGKTASRQQRLLGWCIRALEDNSRLVPSVLNQYGGSDTIFRANEPVDVAYEPISMGDFGTLWDLLKPNAHVSVGYIARMIYIESAVEIPTGEPVQARVYDMVRRENGAS
jgi:hypothetical protein